MASLLLYKDYKTKSPVLVCPCALKEKVLELKRIMPNGIGLCSYNDLAITVAYLSDLEAYSN